MRNGCDRFDRRFRIYEISDYGETIRTYKRLAGEEVVDEMVLAGRGAPEPYVFITTMHVRPSRRPRPPLSLISHFLA